MEKSILFVNSKQEQIDLFRGACKDTPYVVDCANTGTEAMELLQEKEYAIVIVNRVLRGVDGGEILSYVTQRYPQAICILNAITLSKGDLKFFYNEQKVYRIFLSPVDYRTEMLPVIEDAMYEHDIKERSIRRGLRSRENLSNRRLDCSRIFR